MKYTITINQKAVLDAGFDLDIVDMAIFDMLAVYTNSTACRRMNEGERTYFNVPYQTVINELPLCKITKPDSVYRRFQKLELSGIVNMHPENKKMKQVWFSWGRNYDRLYFGKQTGSKSGQPDKQEVRPDLNPDETGSKSGLRPDENPPHNSTFPFTSPMCESEHAPAEKSADLNTGTQKNTPPNSAPPPQAGGWRPVDPDLEIQYMLCDNACKERFYRQCRIPVDQFQGFVELFALKVKSEQATHNNRKDFRSHFFSWATLEFARLKKQDNGNQKFTFDLNKSLDTAAEWAAKFERELAAERALQGR